MDRRKALINMSLSAAGISLSASLIAALGSCESKKQLSYKALTFSAEEDALLQELVELIIPTTDTPGAKAAGVNQYIDRVLSMVSDAPEKEGFVSGLETIDILSQKQFGQTFLKLSQEDQIKLLQQLESESQTAKGGSFFSLLKSMTIYGYYTSEIGASQELMYVHATGTYDGDIPYSEVGKNYY
ncbi:MAG: gluconate 2-dehydrogenase subunit 3 family protein [Marinoscillum sp.]|uniref:gluconate 2-dehydrogenase subunit 3 family protein n=1 Tax=Marinoscillum sp. TaxID=2024838 RepID=UPI0032F64E35